VNSDDWDRRYAATGLVWSATPNVFVEQEAADLPAGRALDLATGEGRNALWLAGRGWSVTGVDFSSVALDKARALADAGAVPTERLTWECADATAYPVAPGAYDLVVVAYLQLPAPERAAAMRVAARALAPGGTLLVVAHDSANLADGVGGPQDPEVLYTPQDVLTDLADTGLETQRAQTVQRPVEVDGQPRIALDALVRLRRPV
jgi:SAM-dependent methyltransferase